MPDHVTTFSGRFEENSSSMGEKLLETTTEVKDKMSQLGDTAADKIDKDRDAAAGGLERAASAIRDKAERLPGGEKVASLAHATPDKLNATAQYTRTPVRALGTKNVSRRRIPGGDCVKPVQYLHWATLDGQPSRLD